MLVSVGQRGVGLSAVLRENEYFSKTILACLSERKWAGFIELKKCQKSRDTVTLNRIYNTKRSIFELHQSRPTFFATIVLG